MSKRRLFIADENSPDLKYCEVRENSPPRGGIHPALLTCTNSKSKKDPKTPEKPAKRTPNVSKKKSEDIFIAPDSDSESDSMEEADFFSKSSLKLPYTKEEDEIILNYVLKGENIYKVTSLSLWKYLEAKKEKPKRTYQSLKNRFLRNIKPFLFTKYRNFIKDKETMQKIISKFPELKQQVGRKETLTKIQLPERKSPSKICEEERVSSTSANECEGNTERAKVLQTPDPDPKPNPVVHPEVQLQKLSKTSRSNSLKTEIYERTVNIESDGISVLVNFRAKKLADIPKVGIYEKFKKLQEENELILCPTCGHYNLPEKVSLVDSTAESDVIISNSVNTQKDRKVNLKSRSKSSKTKKQRRGGSGSNLSQRSPSSPSLISEVGEASDSDQPPRKRAASNIQIPQVSEVSNSTPSNEVKIVNNPSLLTSEKEISVTRTRSRSNKASTLSSNTNAKNSKKASNSKSNSDSSSSKRLQDSDDDGDSLYEETVANFRKLIDSKEERILLGKCLNKAIGLEGASQNLESYIFESSSDLEIPPLTIDYETDSQNTNNDTEFESTTNSLLADNMRKMFNKIISKSKNS